MTAGGLVSGGQWDDALAVISRYGTRPTRARDRHRGETDRPRLSARAALDSAHRALDERSHLSETVARLLLEILKVLSTTHELDDANALLSDRTFLVKAPRVLKAAALRRGSLAVAPEDLRVLRFLTTFRVPSEVHETVPRVIEEVIQRFNQAEGGGAGGGDGGGGKGDGGENAGARGDGSAGSSGARQPPEAAPQAHSRRTLEDVHGDGTTWNVNQRYNLSAAAISELWRRLRNVARKLSHDHGAAGTAPPVNLERETITGRSTSFSSLCESVRRLTSAVAQGSTPSSARSGSIPTRSARRRRACGWRAARLARGARTRVGCRGTTPTRANRALGSCSVAEAARMRRRARRARGGAVAIVRDISASMWGLHAKWASSVILRLVDTVARRAKMRVAYLEFNEQTFRLSTERAGDPSDDRSAKTGARRARSRTARRRE